MKLPKINLDGERCHYCGKPAERVASKFPWDLTRGDDWGTYVCARCWELHAQARQDSLAKLQAMALSGALTEEEGSQKLEAMTREMEQWVRDRAGGQ